MDKAFDTTGFDTTGFDSPFPDEGVQLPFFAPVLFWKHGNPQAGDGVQRYGGWGSASELYDFGDEPPKGFVAETWHSSSGGAYDVFAARSVAIAPILTRTRWTTNEFGKSRSHKQSLCMLATWDEVTYVPYGPVILSTKGLSSRYVVDAITEFERQINGIRKENIAHIGLSFFWHTVGTFGDAAYDQMGSGTQTSTGTIVRSGVVVDPTIDTLKALFVGVDVMNMMKDYQSEAQEWYSAWKDADNIKIVETPVDDGEQQYVDMSTPF